LIVEGGHRGAAYSFVNPLRAFVTLKDPSRLAETFSQ
jgi:hypothetical protein